MELNNFDFTKDNSIYIYAYNIFLIEYNNNDKVKPIVPFTYYQFIIRPEVNEQYLKEATRVFRKYKLSQIFNND